MPTFASRRTGALVAVAVALLPLCGFLVPHQVRAQATTIAAYIAIRGTDTLGTESLRITDSAVTGVWSMRGQPRIEWKHLRRGQSYGALSMQVFAAGSPAGSTPQQTAGVRIVGDSAATEVSSGAQRSMRMFASKTNALPLINASVLHELLLAGAAKRANSPTFDVFLTSGAQTITGTQVQRGDTLIVSLGGSEVRAIMGADGLPVVIVTPQGVRITRLTALPAGGAAALGTINYDAPASAPYIAEQVRIPSGRGYDLAATLTKPRGVAKMPVVITISGSGPQERDSRVPMLPAYAFFREIADTLGRRGVAVLRFDDRGVGASGGRESAAKGTSADFADDVRSIITWLRARSDVDGSRIALAGHSEGGMIAPMVAVTDPKLRAIALLAGPGYAGRRVSLYQNRVSIDAAPGLSKAQRDSIMASVPARLDSAGRANPWLGFWLTYDPLVTARRVKQPVLILQGLTDTQISPEQADSLAVAVRSGGNQAVTLRAFPATNHLFLEDPSGAATGYGALKNAHARREVLGALADWAVKVLK